MRNVPYDVRLISAAHPLIDGECLTRPIFSAELDAHPEVKAWLEKLSEEERRSLRDDVTPSFKEIPIGVKVSDVASHVPDEPSEPGDDDLDEEVRAQLRDAMMRQAEVYAQEGAPASSGEYQMSLFAELAGGDSRKALLPEWQLRALLAWLEGRTYSAIARSLGISRATVRCALDGHAGRPDSPYESRWKTAPGAIATFVDRAKADEVFLRRVEKMSKPKPTVEPRITRWFTATPNKPELFAALAFLFLLSELAGKGNTVRVDEVLPLVPRAVVSPLLLQLKAHGYAVSDGHTITIHRTPVDKEAA